MDFSLLTYNLMFNRAVRKLERIFTSYSPDILCLQEIKTDEESLKSIERFGYKPADFSNNIFRFGRVFGVTTFYNLNKFTLTSSENFNLPPSLFERLLFFIQEGAIPRTVLRTDFIFKKNSKKITLYNIHLSPFATNTIRKRQLLHTFRVLRLGKKNPIIIAGDFNYPYKRKEFESLIGKYNLKEATRNIIFTSNFLKIFPIKLKLDYILYKNLILNDTKRLQIKLSDHYPIISTFAFKQKFKT